MANQGGPLRDIAWNDIFPGLLLLRVFRLACDPRKIIFAALALMLTFYGWRGIGMLFPDDATAGHLLTTQDAAIPAGDGITSGATPIWLMVNPVFTPWEHLSRPFRWMFTPGLSWSSLAVSALCALWVALVWSFLGAVITRIAAVELTREERVSIASALSHARRKAGSYGSAILLPLVGVAIAAAVFGVVPGVIMQSGDFGLFLFGVIYPLVLLVVGLPSAILLFGLAVGWPLMWAAISVEASDAFDAISRSYAYTFQRPLHYALYALAAGVVGLFAWAVIVLFVMLMIHATVWGISWGSGYEHMAEVLAWSQQGVEWPLVTPMVETSKPESLGPAGNLGLSFIALSMGFVKLLMLGFAYSYFWTTATAIYLLLRRSNDATEMDNVYQEDLPEVAPLPELRTDESGVPVLADDPAMATDAD